MATVAVNQGTLTQCPACGTKGKKVPSETVAALVKAKQQSAVGEGAYRFCESPQCDVVYFSESDPQHQFKQSDLRVRVGQKETGPDRQVCYCFDWTAADIEREIRATGKTTIRDRIRRMVQDGYCRCETMNPQGSCCLGNVSTAANQAEQKLHGSMGLPTTPDEDTAAGSSCSLENRGQTNSGKARRRERGALLASVGAVFSAVVASACCWLPLALLAVGISGVGVAGIFERYRPIFLTGTFALLSVAWYLTYRPTVQRWLARSRAKSGAAVGAAMESCCAVEPAANATVAAPTHSCCAGEPQEDAAAESGCAPAVDQRRFTLRQFNVGMLWVATAVALLFAFFPHWIGFVLQAGRSGPAESSVTLQQYAVRIEGMTCEGCAATLEKALGRVPKVKEVHVSYPDGRAIIGVEPGEEFPKAEVISAIENAGYRAGPVQPDAASSNLRSETR